MRKLVVFTLAFVLAGCALFTSNDPVRVGLFTAKQTYLAGREGAIVACSKKLVSEADCKKFRATDEAYTKKHNEAVALYLAAKPVADQVLVDLKKLAEEFKALAERINRQAEVAAEVGV